MVGWIACLGDENSDHEKSNVWKKTEWAGLICIFFIRMVLIHMLWNSGADGEMADIRSVSSGWYQIVDEKEEALDLPARLRQIRMERSCFIIIH